MREYEVARTKIIKELDLSLSLQEIKTLELILSWLYNKGAGEALTAMEKSQREAGGCNVG